MARLVGALSVLYRLVVTPLFVPLFYGGAMILSWLVLPGLSLTTREPRRRVRRCQAALQAPFRLMFRVGRALRLLNLDLTPDPEGCPETASVIVANHPTLIDIVAFTAIYGEMCFVVKRTLFRSLLVGGILRFSRHIPSSDGSTADSARVLADAVDRLRKGHHVLLFPEGTRSPPGDLNPLKRGACEIASRATVPLTPCVITCHPPFLTKEHRWLRRAERPEMMMKRLPTMHPADWQHDSRAMAREMDIVWRRALFGEEPS